LDLIHLIILGLIQGLTEFLPISSSAHLILLPIMTGWSDQGLAYDIAAHLGSLIAVIFYFRRDLTRIVKSWCQSFFSGPQTADSRMVWYLLTSTIPIGLAALLLHDVVATVLRDPLVIAVATIMFGLILWWADLKGERLRDVNSFRWRDVLVIACAQILALIPGASRSGVTITAGLMLGFDRTTASRFSFLMAVPTILLAVAYEIYTLQLGTLSIDWMSLFIVVIVSCASALLSVHLFLQFLERIGMMPFVLYRLLLGSVLLAVFL